jgi:hypothetical protein
MLEIGIMAGQSVQMWNDYFPAATIFAMDWFIHDLVISNLAPLDRVYLLVSNCQDTTVLPKLILQLESIEFIVDDGPHSVQAQEKTLFNYWRYLKPGGLYVIEDIDYVTNFGQNFQQHPEKLQPFTREIMRQNSVYLVDTLVGHRAYEEFQRRSPNSTVSRVLHNSYMLVIRKSL